MNEIKLYFKKSIIIFSNNRIQVIGNRDESIICYLLWLFDLILYILFKRIYYYIRNKFYFYKYKRMKRKNPKLFVFDRNI